MTLEQASPATIYTARKDVNWTSAIGKEAKGSDSFSFGEVKEVASDYVLTEKGALRKEKFYVPKRFVDRFDGRILWFAATKTQAESEFRRDGAPAPDEYKHRYTTVERYITERVVEIGPSGERKETISERRG